MTLQNTIHIALVDLQNETALWQWLTCERESYLLAQEWQRAYDIAHPQRRLTWLLGRALRRRLLSDVCGVAPLSLEFAQTAAGKPYLQQGLAFNLSHSDRYLAIGWCESGQLGVDVDRLSRTLAWEKLAVKYLGRAERATLASLPPTECAQQFIAHWSMKEAWLKSRGEKIAGSALAQWQFELCDGYADALFSTTAQLRQWRFGQQHVLSCVWQPEISTGLLAPTESCDTSVYKLLRWEPAQDQLQAFSAVGITAS